MDDTTPLYNLKAVCNEVGVNPVTLRAWERRYDLLKPVRTPGGHRLYSRQDITMLKWLVERQNEGLSISRAVEMWNQLKESGQQAIPQTWEHVAGESMLDELRDQWMAACLSFDDGAANQALDQAFSIAIPETICNTVLLKGLSQMGERWYRGSATVQQEHFASEIAARRIHTLLTACGEPTRTGCMLAACPPGEEHDFPLLTTSFLLRRRGWEVIYLGANVPLSDLDTTIGSRAPIMVVSSAQTLNSAASLRRLSEYLHSKGITLAYGGGIFNQIPAICQAISGHFLGREVAGVVPAVERLTASELPTPDEPPLSKEYSRTLAKFQQKRASIIEFVMATTQVQTPNPANLPLAVECFVGSIASALDLGDINYLVQPMVWLRGLLDNHGFPEGEVKEILGTTLLAVDSYLRLDGEIISIWLKQQMLTV